MEKVMTPDRLSEGQIECRLLWKLARAHGWSTAVDVADLAGVTPLPDEQRGREVARDRLADRDFVGYHQGHDQIWLRGPPSEAVPYFLRDDCDYGELQIEATFNSYFDGF